MCRRKSIHRMIGCFFWDLKLNKAQLLMRSDTLLWDVDKDQLAREAVAQTCGKKKREWRDCIGRRQWRKKQKKNRERRWKLCRCNVGFHFLNLKINIWSICWQVVIVGDGFAECTSLLWRMRNPDEEMIPHFSLALLCEIVKAYFFVKY